MTPTRLRPADYIGGEMEIEEWSGCDGGPAFRPPRGAISVATGRTGLFLAGRAALRRRARTAIVPSYICASVVQALKAAGLRVRHYAIGQDLELETDVLVDAVERWSPALVVVVHYFGFPAPPRIFDRLERLERRFDVLEDCAHGSWIESTKPAVGLRGSFVLTSFRKYLRVPDGGLLLNRTGVPIPRPRPAGGEFVDLRLAAKILRGARLRGAVGRQADEVYLDLFQRAEREIDRRVPVAAMSPVSAALLGAERLREVMNRRRSNYRHLQAAIAARTRIRRFIRPLFDRLPGGASPLLLPVRVAGGARNLLRERLLNARVFCPVLWPLPSTVRPTAFPAAHQLSAEMLGLPIDQRYDAAAMDDMVQRLEFACRAFA